MTSKRMCTPYMFVFCVRYLYIKRMYICVDGILSSKLNWVRNLNSVIILTVAKFTWCLIYITPELAHIFPGNIRQRRRWRTNERLQAFINSSEFPLRILNGSQYNDNVKHNNIFKYIPMLFVRNFSFIPRKENNSNRKLSHSKHTHNEIVWHTEAHISLLYCAYKFNLYGFVMTSPHSLTLIFS